MVQDQGLDVYLAPFSDTTKRYQQHTVPAGSPNFTGDPNEVYIEAVNGERFMVVVDVMKDFDMRSGTHLSIAYELDQNRGSSRINSDKSLPDLQKGLLGEPDLKGRDILEETTRKVDGEWLDCGFTFCCLETGTDSHLREYLRGSTDIE